MTDESVVAVYGVPVGQAKVQRIGSGTLPLSRLVLVDPPLDAQLGSNVPPWVLRVGIASEGNGQVEVEVIEVLQVLQSAPDTGPIMWALELVEPAQSPVSFGSSAPPPPNRPQWDLIALRAALRRMTRRPTIGPRQPHLPSPDSTQTESDRPEQPTIVPAGLWCRLFPRATFCN